MKQMLLFLPMLGQVFVSLFEAERFYYDYARKSRFKGKIKSIKKYSHSNDLAHIIIISLTRV